MPYNTYEQALIDLTDYGRPPTTLIAKNLAEEIRGECVGKNWTARLNVGM